MSRLAPLLRPQTRQPATKIATRSMGNWITCGNEESGKHGIQHNYSRHDGWGTEYRRRDVVHGRQPSREYGIRHRSSFFSTARRRTVTAIPAPRQAREDISQRDYEDLVDLYPSFSVTEQGAKELSEKKKREHMPLAPRLVVTPEQEVLPPYSARVILPPEDEDHAKQLGRFIRLVKRKRGDIKLDKLWQSYEQLRSPRPRYLKDALLRRALGHFGWVENWYQQNAMQRYFQFLDDCLAEGAIIKAEQWTTAVSFAGRCVRDLKPDEIKRAIETWMQMERHGHEANHVTFNILFDVAVKAGRFALADTIYSEIMARDMPLDRWARGSLIYYAGLRRDGDGVRKCFKDFVEAGEIVDTTIMNAVVVSLLRAGEASAAEHVFSKMKRLHRDKFGTQSLRDWRDKKEMQILLQRTSEHLRKEKQEHESSFFGAPFSSDERRDELQKAAPIAPDADTYQILIKYHAYTSGDIDRIWDLLDEMREHELRVYGSTYVHLLRGFHAHGGYAFSAWNPRRLEEVWQEIVRVCAPVTPAHEINAHAQKHDSSKAQNTQHSASSEPDQDYESLDTAQYGGPGSKDSPYESVDAEATSNNAKPFENFDLLGAMLSSRADGSMGGSSSSTFEPLEAVEHKPRVKHRIGPSDADLFKSESGFGSFDASGGILKRALSEPNPDSPRRFSEPSGTSTDEPFASHHDEELDDRPVFEQDRSPYMTTGFGVAAIRAFYHCMGIRRMLDIFDELKARWLGEAEIDWTRIEREVDKCKMDADKYVDPAK